MAITLTENAVKEIKKVMSEQGMTTEAFVLRVGVASGGCSGFSYDLQFAKNEEVDELNDETYEFDGLKAVVDRKSEIYLGGTTLDFYEDIARRGFVFDNPQAKGGGCGCGKSFNPG